MARILCAAILLVLCSEAAGAQGPPSPPPPTAAPRDINSPALSKGKSIIRGRVVSADTGKPLRRALVRLSAPGGDTRTMRICPRAATP